MSQCSELCTEIRRGWGNKAKKFFSACYPYYCSDSGAIVHYYEKEEELGESGSAFIT